MPDTKPSGPVEVWLTVRESGFGVVCNVVKPGGTTDKPEVQAISMRGAQREMTAHLIETGYTPAGRWQTEATDKKPGEVLEASRKFTLANAKFRPPKK